MEIRFAFPRCLLLVLVTGIAHLHTSASVPLVKSPPSMLDTIAVCQPVAFVTNSSYLSDCQNISYPTKYIADDKKLAMCMTVYDITNKICLHDSKQDPASDEKKILELPKTSAEFDATLAKLEPNSPYKTFKDSLCKNISSLFIKLAQFESIVEVVDYVKDVNKSLSADDCEYTCHAFNRVDKFCMIFSWANNLFSILQPKETVNNDKEKIPEIKPSTPTINVEVKIPTLERHDNGLKDNLSKNKEEPNPVPTKQSPTIKVEINNDNKKEQKNSETSNDQNEENVVHIVEHNNKKNVIKNNENSKPVNERQNKDIEPLPSNDKIKDSKLPSNIEEIHDIPPLEDRNPEDLVSNEEPNKKSNDNEAEDINEHENIDDEKESNNNLEEKMFSNKQEQFNLPQETRKYYPAGSEEDESHFFTYFSIITICCILLYIGYHNKQKILAMALEGRRSRGGRRSRRRPSTASYHKLDSTLEEAVTSQCNSNVTHVIY